MSTPGVHVRSELSAVPLYVPGRSEAAVKALFQLDRVVKLASNEAAHGPLPGVLEDAASRAVATHRYPDTESTALRGALGDRFDLPVERIVAGAGSVGLLQQLVTATAGPGDEVVFAWRSFEAYPVFPAIVGATAVRVPLTADARHDIPAMIAAVTERTRLLIVCTPNNPTGPAVTGAELTELIEAVPPTVTVVIDEAYREYVDDPDVADGLDLAKAHRHVAVLRTFSKAYGLAALRVGWCFAPAELAIGLRRTQVPFAVGTLAQEAAVLSLAQQDLVDARAKEIVGERARVSEALAGLGLAIPPSQGNFVWLPLGELARPVAAALEERGVIARPYADDGMRVTIGLPEENDVFLAALPAALVAVSGAVGPS